MVDYLRRLGHGGEASDLAIEEVTGLLIALTAKSKCTLQDTI